MDTSSNSEVVKKKRGRKPKVVEVSAAQPADDDGACACASECVETQDVKKTKRGRKPKYVYSTQDVVSSQHISISDDENIIVKLNINDDMLFKGEESRYDDEHPYAYNRDEYYNLSNYGDCEKMGCATGIECGLEEQSTEVTRKVVSLLKDFEEKNKINEWPSNTSICCYWCCHKFDNAPFGIPVNYTKSNFDVFGCFCSLECAAAYNFKVQDNVDEMWERYNLINLLHRKLELNGKVVKPAPDRLALKMFGGHLDIEEFRHFFKSNKLVNVNFPPMSSLTQQIEEVNEYELNNDYKYIPIDTERIDKYKAKMMFKRNKPLVNTKNSIESIMNLKYS